MSDFINGQKLKAEAVRSIAFGSLSGTYADIGSVTANPARIIMVKNATDSDVTVSWDDGTTDVFFLPAGSQDTIDVVANGGPNGAFLEVGSQFQAKTAGSPTSGSVVVQLFYVE